MTTAPSKPTNPNEAKPTLALGKPATAETKVAPEAKISLTPGPHTLQLVLGDAKHVPHDPPVYSKQIKVVVNATGRRPQARKRHYHHYYNSYR